MNRLTKEMDVLLEKLLRKETSPDEEKTIEIYLLMSDLPQQHVRYRELIKEINKQKKAHYKNKLINSLKKRNLTLLPYSKIAILIAFAVVTTCFVFQLRKTEESVAYVKGEKITDPKYIEHYAQKKIVKLRTKLIGCLDPLEDIQKMKIGLEKAELAADLLQHSLDKPLKKLSLKKKKDEKINNSNPTSDTTNKRKEPKP